MEQCIDHNFEFKDCPCKFQYYDRTCCNFEELYEVYRKVGEKNILLDLVCVPAKIEIYCKEYSVNLCRNTTHPCPCKIFYENRLFCNFGNVYGELIFNQDNNKAKILVNIVCSLIKEEVQYHEFIAEDAIKSERKFLTQSIIGQEVFCTTECENVILLEKPNDVGEKCKYKTHKGKIGEQSTFCFRLVSKSNNFSEYEVKGKDYKMRAQYLEFLARFNGFRTEKHEVKNSFLLKIYGDSKEEVDDFITLCCNSDFVLF